MSSQQFKMRPTSRQPLSAIHLENGRRNNLTLRSATSDDDVNDNDTSPDASSDRDNWFEPRKTVGARVRQSVTKASKKVKNLWDGSASSLPDSARVREVVTLGGSPIAGVLADAALNAAELAAEEVRAAASDVLKRNRIAPSSGKSNNNNASQLETSAQIEADAQVAMDAISLAKTSVADAFDAAESALSAAENELQRVRTELEGAKRDATLGLAVAEKAASDAAVKARRATESVLVREIEAMEGLEENDHVVVDDVDEGGEDDEVVVESLQSDGLEVKVEPSVVKEEEESEEVSPTEDDETAEDEGEVEKDEGVEKEDEDDEVRSAFDIVSDLTYEDIDYTLTDMAPPFINEDECLVPGEPVVRVEKAPQNSRRIFAGIDIPVSVDDVWDLLTDYPNLQKVVPNLVVNEVLELYPGSGGSIGKVTNNDGDDDTTTTTLSAEEQCQTLADQMKGAVLKQVGGAKVVGINFSARTTLEVREWPLGMPDFAHFEKEVYEGKSRSTRVRESKGRELIRYVFPRPFALSSLPHKDISMQSVVNDDGEFRMYQGVWRMQPLPGCSPAGGSAMRLTYAVEVSPRPYLPVALVEGRIAQDLCNNLKAIRNIMAAKVAEDANGGTI